MTLKNAIAPGGTGDLVFAAMLGLLISAARDCRDVSRTSQRRALSPVNSSRTPPSGRPENLASTA